MCFLLNDISRLIEAKIHVSAPIRHRFITSLARNVLEFDARVKVNSSLYPFVYATTW